MHCLCIRLVFAKRPIEPGEQSIFDPVILNLAVALGIGLIIGAERERRKGEGPSRSPAGIRTFAITSLAGAISFIVGGQVLLAVETAGVIILTAAAYWRGHEDDPGLTTEIALIVTSLLGGLSMQQPALAAGLAVIVAVLLAARSRLHSFVRLVLTEDELQDALIFAGATLVVLPLVPDLPMGPYGALNPHSIWILVILVMAISAVGYLAVRVLGARFGLPIAGLASGFISSTATIGAMGARVAKAREVLAAAVAGAVLSTVATIVQMALVLAATSMTTLRTLLVPLMGAGLAAIAYGAVFTVLALRQKTETEAQSGRAFSLSTALVFALTLSSILVASAALREWFGETGIIIAAALAGFVDTHSAAISVATLVASGKTSASDAVVPILAGLSTNTISKMFLAGSTGGRAFALRVIPGLIIVALAAWAGALSDLLPG
ncbi:MAG: MgtC/SapB family protein [Xanthobacteraceae bacterium]